MDALDALVKVVVAEIPESPTTTLLLDFVPRFIKEAEALTVPGAEKKAAVLSALNTLLDLLQATGKMEASVVADFKTFVATTLSVAIDTLIQEAKKAAATAATAAAAAEEEPNAKAKAEAEVKEAEVVTVQRRVNCILQGVLGFLALFKALRKSATSKKVVAATVATVDSEAVANLKEPEDSKELEVILETAEDKEESAVVAEAL